MVGKRPKILFVIPPCFLDRGPGFEIGLPVQIALLGRVARERGWSVEYLDMTLEEKEGHDSLMQLAPQLDDPNLRVAGISNHTVRTSVTTRFVAECIKNRRPDVKIVVGGVNATFMWQELLTRCPAIDWVLRGYGQPGLKALLACIESGTPASAPGLAQRRNGAYHVEETVPVTPDDFRAPSLEGLEAARYLAWTRTYPILTHTGCGFSCNFCTSVMPGPYHKREVYRPSEHVIADVIQALDVGFDRFFISDNVFTSCREHCLSLCHALHAKGVPDRATWVCMTRVEFVDGELLRAMRAAGCVNIGFGLESAGPGQWKSLGKGRYSEDTIRRAFHLARQAGIGTTAFLMLGSPSQTQGDVDATVELVREVDPDYRVVSFFQPFPGTPYWNSPQDFGLSEIAPLDQWNFHEAPICRTRHLTKTALMEAAIRLCVERKDMGWLEPCRDALQLVGEIPDEYGPAPAAARVALHWLDGIAPVAEVLERVRRVYGPRGRLIALYWLSAATRDGAIAVCDAVELEVAHEASGTPF